jgi:AcrR family transcriptional regulator
LSPRTYDMSKRRVATAETRRRILDATMALHAEQGILATSWEDIARRADVAVGTVYRHFRSLDELLPACGELTLRRLALPDATRRRELFAGAEGAEDRVRRLVDEAYGMYERADDAMVAVRRERDRAELPPVRDAHDQVERALDALVHDALRPLTASRSARRVARALCDHDTWRALRRQGLGAEEAAATTADLIAAALGR